MAETTVDHAAEAALAKIRTAADLISQFVLSDDADAAAELRSEAANLLEAASHHLRSPALVVEPDFADAPDRWERTELACGYGCGCSVTVNVDNYGNGAAYDPETGEYLADLRNQSYCCTVLEHGCLLKVFRHNLETYGHERGYEHPKAHSWRCPSPCGVSLQLNADSVGGPSPVWEHGGAIQHVYPAVLAHQDLEHHGPIWVPDFGETSNA